jgi:hypothetical protein
MQSLVLVYPEELERYKEHFGLPTPASTRRMYDGFGGVYFAVMHYISTRPPLVKIGFASNVATRITSIQTSCPFEISLDLVLHGTQSLEVEMHEKFKEYHLRGDWFRCNGSLFCFIYDLSPTGYRSVGSDYDIW